MNETGIYSVDELRETSLKCLEQDYRDTIRNIMASCNYVARIFGYTEANFILEKKELVGPITNYFKLKGFNIKQLKELELLISWE